MGAYSDFAKELLNKHHLKATTTRIKLIEIIKTFKTAIPYTKIQEHFKDSDRITLYRTIQTLLKKEIIHKALINKEETYYALYENDTKDQTHSHNHVHFKCTVCNHVSCQYLYDKISVTLPNFTIDTMQIQLTGICNLCTSKGNQQN
ncbi:Fur family transcriptional regulator [Aquimarina agarivorans]|uniref:Fur family transcriptional regulator n=1 Tax=Aquimarina agarivorans TaxID=980584 RepID=UPI000248F026|nr:Fur family transcriptional regulator [Aquimarina agarivorans]